MSGQSRTGKETLQRKASWLQSRQPILSPDGKVLATLSQGGCWVVELLDPCSGQSLLPVSENHSFVVSRVAFTPDGKTLLSLGGDSMRSWDAVTGRRGLENSPFTARDSLSAVSPLVGAPL